MAARRGGARPQALPSASRLRRRRDYERCYRTGRRFRGAYGTVIAVGNGEGRPRLGLTVSRKVGGAVVRNRIKRRIREIFRQWSPPRPGIALDLVVHALPAMRRASFAELRRELETLLRRAAETPGRER